MDLVYCGIGLLVGIIFCYLILKPKLKQTEKINQEIIDKNKQIQQDVND